MKKIMMGCAAGLLSVGVHAQDEAVSAPAEAAPNALETLDQRWYVSPSLFWAFADGGRDTDDGYGVSLAAGRAITAEWVLEGVAQYGQFDHEQGSDTADLIGLGVNGLFFPTKTLPAYLLVGAGYGNVSSHPGGDEDYSTFLLNVGGGYWWKPFDLGFIKGLSLRTDAMWRLDAHNDRRTGDTEDNGRKAFQDIVLSVGLMVPIGEVAAPPPPPAEPVDVIPAAVPADSDGDGVGDDVDQCPDTPAGAAVDASGCPLPPPAPACKSPEPGEKLDLSGCGTGDVIVLKGVTFEFNQDRLTPNAKTILDGVSEALATAATTNVEIGGHTDAKGSDDYNQQLSDRRACAVGRYLRGKGVDAGRMSPLGYGETRPVADNETDEGREQNRRVELRILDSEGAGLGSCRGAAPAPSAPPAAMPEAVSEPVTEPASDAVPEAEPAAEPLSEAQYQSMEPSAEAEAESAPAEAAAEPVAEAPAAPAEPAAESQTDAPPPSAEPVQMVPESEVF